MDETLEDARRYSADTPVLLAGDLNMDVSVGNTAQAMHRADFRDTFETHHTPTTPSSFFEEGRMIDWIFARGPVRSGLPQVHRSIAGSDHYPLSVCLDFR